MVAQVIDGKAFAAKVRAQVADQVAKLKEESGITPVPGGVGPMTIACLLANTLTAACRANKLPEPEGLTA